MTTSINLNRPLKAFKFVANCLSEPPLINHSSGKVVVGTADRDLPNIPHASAHVSGEQRLSSFLRPTKNLGQQQRERERERVLCGDVHFLILLALSNLL